MISNSPSLSMLPTTAITLEVPISSPVMVFLRFAGHQDRLQFPYALLSANCIVEPIPPFPLDGESARIAQVHPFNIG
ncbi:MAG: hypothetical protein CM1200mP20_06950 [Pseudomonadota bacterium]|nr:MAG: hypothetical protein CM1200mP20_06950 [Pseudomonadota bacterium]